MIFRSPLIRQIVAGRKTQTRRPVKRGETDCRYQPGRSYAIQPGRCESAIARLVVTDVRQEALGDLTAVDARSEGFKRVDEFVTYWTTLYGRHDPDQAVWVISFHLDRQAPVRLLHRDSTHATSDKSPPGYTDDPRLALPGEPEAIDAWTTHGFARDAQRNRELVAAEDLLRDRARSLARRVREETLRAGRAGVDITVELGQVEAQLQSMERKRVAA